MSDFLPQKKTGERLELLDFWRSLSLFLMIIWHGCYDAVLLQLADASLLSGFFPELVKNLCGASFVLISGLCVTISRDSTRRGFFVFLAGLLVSVATALIGYPVAFGILQLLGVCMLLYRPLARLFRAFPPAAGAALCLCAFFLSGALLRDAETALPFLYPLGLHTADFFSADYYPLLPWAFLFYAAAAAAPRLLPRLPRPHLPAALTAPGRCSLWIYLLHQPILLAVLYLVSRLDICAHSL